MVNFLVKTYMTRKPTCQQARKEDRSENTWCLLPAHPPSLICQSIKINILLVGIVRTARKICTEPCRYHPLDAHYRSKPAIDSVVSCQKTCTYNSLQLQFLDLRNSAFSLSFRNGRNTKLAQLPAPTFHRESGLHFFTACFRAQGLGAKNCFGRFFLARWLFLGPIPYFDTIEES